MSDQTASLPADMLAPVNDLSKAGQQAIAGIKSAGKEQVAALEQENKVLEDKRNLLVKQEKESKDYDATHPFPKPDIKPWTEKPPENDPLKRFGSWASAFGILAGAITKTGLSSSLNAAAAGMNAIRQNDMDAYHEAKAAWKENTEIAIQQAEWESKAYQHGWDLMAKNQALGLAQLQTSAEQAKNKGMIAAIKAGDYKTAFEISTGLANFAKDGPERVLRMQELGAKIEDQMMRANLFKQWRTEHPTASPEEQARAMTQIMSPQYTINQAKTLAEGAAGGSNGFLLTPEASKIAAEKWLATGQLPATGGGKAGASQRAQVMNMGADLLMQRGGNTGTMVANAAKIKGEQTALNKLIPQQAAIESFENTALANGKVLLQLGQKVDQTGVPVIERWIRNGRQSLAGDTDVTEFNTQLALFAPEVARILTNPTLTGVLTDNARAESEKFIPAGVTADQLKKLIPLLEADFKRRSDANQNEIDKRASNIEGIVSGELKKTWDSSPSGDAKPVAPTPPSDLLGKPELTWDGKKNKWFWQENGQWQSRQP